MMPDSKQENPFVFDQSAFENFCAGMVGANFSPVPGTGRAEWIGPLPESLKGLTDARTIRVRIPHGWPAVAAKPSVAGLVADHATSAAGVICLWASDDPAQVKAQTWDTFSARLDSWAQRSLTAFQEEDRALDAWAYYSPLSPRVAEIDLPELLGPSPQNGDLHVVYGTTARLLTFGKARDEDHPLQGVVLFRDAVKSSPRNLEQFRDSLTRRQRDNLRHGLSRRETTAENQPSSGYDFAVLVWPKFGQFEAIVISFEGAGASLVSKSHVTSPNDTVSRLRRAGPDAAQLAAKRAVIVGVGSVGSQVAQTLAASGIGNILLSDSDDLRSVNLVRHALPEYLVGFPKTRGMVIRLAGTAPWCNVETTGAMPVKPAEIAEVVRGADLVIDCTGNFATTLSISHACQSMGIALIAGSLAREGRIFRLQRQIPGDVPILQRNPSEYPRVPPDPEDEAPRFLELGCTAPVNNAPPAAVTRAAADLAMASIDLLLGSPLAGEEIVTVLRPINSAPFDVVGTHVFPAPPPQLHDVT